MTITPRLLEGCARPEDRLGDTGLMQGLKRALMQRMLGAELVDHLGYERGAAPPAEHPNRRIGASRGCPHGNASTWLRRNLRWNATHPSAAVPCA